MSTLQLFLGSALNTIVLVLNFNFARGDRDGCNCNFGSIFCSFRREKGIVVLFYLSEFKHRKENSIFARQAKNVSERVRNTSLAGK